jgi:hypothetical protein
LTEILDPYDVEDLVYLYLQVEAGYLVLPKNRHASTPVYEWTMINRDTAEKAIVQVKTGGATVDLAEMSAALAGRSGTAYAYAACGFPAASSDPRISLISNEDLLTFVGRHRRLLPDRLQIWFDLV